MNRYINPVGCVLSPPLEQFVNIKAMESSMVKIPIFFIVFPICKMKRKYIYYFQMLENQT
ncbi:MAG: hypothetical protein A2W97_05425 [Bacteroidetes bacterium GWE2_40_63]|nr:MAG: hypothetical protein A2W84_00875 [Bacteroidetes bacterium GWC2_40_13]OFX93017.1 MAG: hypothetical protein A2W97_05425 [Bacteroidetes bacterium GWE2_40_63]OFY21386.1 MAG: hypothetical protein A2W88_09420 [Bacteroidetes bacterium GWF2_40_13]